MSQDQYNPRIRDEYEIREEKQGRFIRRMINSVLFLFFVGFGIYLLEKNEVVNFGDYYVKLTNWSFQHGIPDNGLVTIADKKTKKKDGQNIFTVLEQIAPSNAYPNGGVRVIMYQDINLDEVYDAGDTVLQNFVVANGQDGLAPYIGEDGYWWIGKSSTGVKADGKNGLNLNN